MLIDSCCFADEAIIFKLFERSLAPCAKNLIELAPTRALAKEYEILFLLLANTGASGKLSALYLYATAPKDFSADWDFAIAISKSPFSSASFDSLKDPIPR